MRVCCLPAYVADKLHVVNEVCDMKNCNNCVFLEARKHKDLYMWVAKTPTGPSAKFLVQNSESAVGSPCVSAPRLACAARAPAPCLPADGCCFDCPLSSVHTMAEVKLTGNCLKGARPVLVFDPAFDSVPAYQIMKELFTQVGRCSGLGPS